MKRYHFSQYEGVNLLKPDYPALDFEDAMTDSKSQDEVFKLVFMCDPLTGRPRSDLGTYMTDNVNPLVRDFIERQLRTDFGQNASVPDGISDNDIALLTRDVHEDEQSYLRRVGSYMQKQRTIYQSELKKQKTAASKVESKSE